MIRIIRIAPTVGKSFNAVVICNDTLGSTETHDLLMPKIEADYGKFTSVQYLDQFMVNDVDVKQFNVERVMIL